MSDNGNGSKQAKPKFDPTINYGHVLTALSIEHDYNSFPVVEAGVILGIVTKFDFLKAFVFTTSQLVPHYDELMQRPVAEVMSQSIVHVEPTTPLTRVLQLMVDHKTRSIPVVSSKQHLAGIISREDVMRALQEVTQISQSPENVSRSRRSRSRATVVGSSATVRSVCRNALMPTAISWRCR